MRPVGKWLPEKRQVVDLVSNVVAISDCLS